MSFTGVSNAPCRNPGVPPWHRWPRPAFVDEQHAATCSLDRLAGLDRGLPDVPGQLNSIHLDDLSVALQDPHAATGVA